MNSICIDWMRKNGNFCRSLERVSLSTYPWSNPALTRNLLMLKNFEILQGQEHHAILRLHLSRCIASDQMPCISCCRKMFCQFRVEPFSLCHIPIESPSSRSPSLHPVHATRQAPTGFFGPLFLAFALPSCDTSFLFCKNHQGVIS